MDGDEGHIAAESTETTAAAAADDETTVVPDITPTGVAPELAWSNFEDSDEPSAEWYTWGATWLNAGLLLLCAVLLATALGFGIWAWLTSHDHDTRANSPALPTSALHPSPSPAPTPLPAAAAPTPTPSSVEQSAPSVTSLPDSPPIAGETKDSLFIRTLRADGITWNTEGNAITAAHTVCEIISQGKGLGDIATLVVQQNPGMYRRNAEAFVNDSMKVYCPQGDF